ncbi:hypothetical protein CYLTODRAFT_490133 [Cylindrobasidium torrendii FP15055 ss-10]|uniref:Uncharacterized protein n=1 Tax=Cylindrobasidium torrendii FP15055 ss-10 TaxID=1314674 RepID=A0A0D7BBY9_9AGAR|nr:hypothetical protein CYLTODRAFT_490133 [Cylindrobasidium torrendii FP15055 ss-10]
MAPLQRFETPAGIRDLRQQGFESLNPNYTKATPATSTNISRRDPSAPAAYLTPTAMYNARKAREDRGPPPVLRGANAAWDKTWDVPNHIDANAMYQCGAMIPTANTVSLKDQVIVEEDSSNVHSPKEMQKQRSVYLWFALGLIVGILGAFVAAQLTVNGGLDMVYPVAPVESKVDSPVEEIQQMQMVITSVPEAMTTPEVEVVEEKEEEEDEDSALDEFLAQLQAAAPKIVEPRGLWNSFVVFIRRL